MPKQLDAEGFSSACFSSLSVLRVVWIPAWSERSLASISVMSVARVLVWTGDSWRDGKNLVNLLFPHLLRQPMGYASLSSFSNPK